MQLRGLLAVPVAVALVTGAPGLAYAAFTARTTAAVSVGTYKIPAPASINGTLHCTTTRGGQKGASITFTDISDVDRATGYTATITAPGGKKSNVLVSKEGNSYVGMYSGNGTGTYTFSVAAYVGSWTGLPLEQTVIC
jgi:hypothetical protein